MSTTNYVVEHFEEGMWIPKLRTNFDDPQFYKVAKSPSYRVMCNGIDVTAKYRDGSDISAPAAYAESPKPPMKPAAYKALSDEEKHALQKLAAELKLNKKKRFEILTIMNVSEATYDTIRADMVESTESDSKPEAPSVDKQSQSSAPVRGKPASPLIRGGLLGRR